MTAIDRVGGNLPRGQATVELDDIQATVLRSRPEPYYGTHVMLHVDDVRAGPGLLRNLTPHKASTMTEQPNVVLIHGAFADGSSWSTVVKDLQAKGYDVTASQFR